MKNNEVIRRKSQLMPVGLKIKSNCYVIGDKYIKSILVTSLPREFGLAMLAPFVSNPHLKIYMSTERLNEDCATMMKKEYNDKEQEFDRNRRNPARQETLRNELISLNTYIKEVVNNHDVTWNVTIVFSVFAETEKEVLSLAKDLKLKLRTEGFRTTSADMMQENLMRIATPVFQNSLLPKEIEKNIGIPLPSLGLAGLYPFIFETLKDPKGFLLAYEAINRGIILFDQFFYKNNPDVAKLTNRINGNLICVGGSGFGKTTTMMLIIRSYIRQGIRLIWIDPENKNAALTRRYGGTFINWGRRGYLINIFDLKPISVEEDEDDSLMWDTEAAIYDVIDDVKIVLGYLIPSITDDTLAVIGDVTVKLYERFHLSFSDQFKGLPPTAFPTFSDFDEQIDIELDDCKKKGNTKEEDILYDLKLKIRPILREWSFYLDGHTTIEDHSDILSFGTKVLYEKPDPLKNALNHIMYKYAWATCLDERQQSAFVLDEAHVQIIGGKSAELVAQFVRRSRKYNNVCCIATQEPKDFAVKDVLIHGKAMFNNSAYKIILHLERDGIKDLQELVTLNNNEKSLIERQMQGDALFICGNRRIPIHVLPTENELREMGM